jgi:hypothetical protein
MTRALSFCVETFGRAKSPGLIAETQQALPAPL